jgi:hypothetical protein
MDYQIKEFNPATAQITVLFIPLNTSFSIDLPVDAVGNVPVGAALDIYIKAFLPYGLVQRQALLAAGVKNAADIVALIQ